MLLIHRLRLLYIFQTDIRQMFNTWWQTLTRKQKWIWRRHRTMVLFQVRDHKRHLWWVMMRCPAHYKTFCLIDLQFLFSDSKNHQLSNRRAEITSSHVWEAIPKWRFYLFKTIKTENRPDGRRGCTVPDVMELWSWQKKKRAGIFLRMLHRIVRVLQSHYSITLSFIQLDYRTLDDTYQSVSFSTICSSP